MKYNFGLDFVMEVMPALLLATNPFTEPTRIPLSTTERTVNHVSWKKQMRLPSAPTTTMTKRRSAAGNQNQSESQSSENNHGNLHHHHHQHSARERKVEIRPLGSMSETQLLRLTRWADEELQQIRRDAGISTPPLNRHAAQSTGLVEDAELQLPKIDQPKPKESSAPASPKSSSAVPVKGKEKDTTKESKVVKEGGKSDGFQRVGRKGYSRVDMVRNLQKHKKSLSASVIDRRKPVANMAKEERRARCATSKVEAVCWGNIEGILKEKAGMKGNSSSSSNSSDDDLINKKKRDRTKFPPAAEKKTKNMKEEIDICVRAIKSATSVRLPQVICEEGVDLSASTLEDVILARLEEGAEDESADHAREDRVRWEGNELGYNPDATTCCCTTRPASSVIDHLDGRRTTAARSEVATPEPSEGALSNDEGERSLSPSSPSLKHRRASLRHSSAVLRDMDGNPAPTSLPSAHDITENVMRKLQPQNPHVIWPENRFLTSNTVFVYGSPSQLAPVIVPSHSIDCPLCNFYTPSAYGEICPPNSPTPFLKKDYGFYPVERFYSDF